MQNTKHSYIPLYCHSLYSFGESSIRVNQLIEYSKKYNIPAIGIVDNGNLFGAFDITNALIKEGIQPIIGINLKLALDKQNNFEEKQKEGVLSFLVTSNLGYQNLLKLIYNAYIANNEEKNNPHLTLEDVKNFSQDLILLTGAKNSILANLLEENNKELAESVINTLHESFKDNLYIQVERQQENNQEELEKNLLQIAKEKNIPIVATNEAFFAKEEDYELHDTYMCITQGVTVFQEDRPKLNLNSYLKSPQEMVEIFKDLPEALENTIKIAQKCCFAIKSIDPQFPKYSDNEKQELIDKVNEGLEKRLIAKSIDVNDPKYRDRVKYELDIIINMHFEGYFLIVYDFINYAKDNNISVGPGRGSGAGSLVAYCLGITDIDPLEFDLLFERFLNPERISMPDFDIDFCPQGRDDVIEYVRNKYGHDHVAQIITFGRLQSRGAVRDTGRALGFAYSEVDRLSKKIPQGTPSNPVTLEQALKEDEGLRDFIVGNERLEQLCDYSMKTEGLYRNISTHAAGVVIAYKPLNETIPVYMSDGQDLPLTGYSMKYVESAGLVKFDFLGLKTLTIVSLTVKNIAKYNNNKHIDVSNISYFDKKTCNLLGSGKTMGVFQVEGEGVRKILTQLKPNSIHDIIAIISLYRPGPIENIPSYIRRKHGQEKVTYQHALMEDVLKDTYGIMIYQEQVMQIAQVIAGYSLGSADILRRAMGKKDKEQMAFEEQRFVEGAFKTNQIDEKLAKEIFNQIEKFAGYGFNKSHAAAYAFISWQTAYLKAYYPEEFFISIMTLDSSSQEDLCNFVYEAKEFNIKILSASINAPSETFQIEIDEDGNKAIRYSIPAIKGISEKLASEIRAEFEANGKYKSVKDFFERVSYKALNKRQLEALIYSGAFDEVESNRKKLIENVEHLLNFAKSTYNAKNSNQISLFGDASPVAEEQDEKSIFQNPVNDAYSYKEKLFKEKDVVGFFIDEHPLSLIQDFVTKNDYKYYDYISSLDTRKNYKDIKIIGTLMEVSLTRSNRGMRAYLFKISDPKTGMYSLTLGAEAFDRMGIEVQPNSHYIFTLKAAPSNNSEDEHWINITSIKPINEKTAERTKLKQKVENTPALEEQKTQSPKAPAFNSEPSYMQDAPPFDPDYNNAPPYDNAPYSNSFESETKPEALGKDNQSVNTFDSNQSMQQNTQAVKYKLKLYIKDIEKANLYILKQQFLSISGKEDAEIFLNFELEGQSLSYFIQKLKIDPEKIENITQGADFVKSVQLV